MTTAQNLLRVAEVAEELHIGRRAVIHRIHAGTLAAIKLGDGPTNAYVITREEVERAKAEMKREAVA